MYYIKNIDNNKLFDSGYNSDTKYSSSFTTDSSFFENKTNDGTFGLLKTSFGTFLVQDDLSSNQTIPEMYVLESSTDKFENNANVLPKPTISRYRNNKLYKINDQDNLDGSSPNSIYSGGDLGELSYNTTNYVKLVETDTKRLFAFKYCFDKILKTKWVELYEWDEGNYKLNSDLPKVKYPQNLKFINYGDEDPVILYVTDSSGEPNLNGDNKGILISKNFGKSWKRVNDKFNICADMHTDSIYVTYSDVTRFYDSIVINVPIQTGTRHVVLSINLNISTLECEYINIVLIYESFNTIQDRLWFGNVASLTPLDLAWIANGIGISDYEEFSYIRSKTYIDRQAERDSFTSRVLNAHQFNNIIVKKYNNIISNYDVASRNMGHYAYKIDGLHYLIPYGYLGNGFAIYNVDSGIIGNYYFYTGGSTSYRFGTDFYQYFINHFENEIYTPTQIIDYQNNIIRDYSNELKNDEKLYCKLYVDDESLYLLRNDLTNSNIKITTIRDSYDNYINLDDADIYINDFSTYNKIFIDHAKNNIYIVFINSDGIPQIVKYNIETKNFEYIDLTNIFNDNDWISNPSGINFIIKNDVLYYIAIAASTGIERSLFTINLNDLSDYKFNNKQAKYLSNMIDVLGIGNISYSGEVYKCSNTYGGMLVGDDKVIINMGDEYFESNERIFNLVDKGFHLIPNSIIKDTNATKIINSDTRNLSEVNYYSEDIKDFDIVDYNGVLFVKAFNGDIYKFDNQKKYDVETFESKESNDVAYELRATFDTKGKSNNNDLDNKLVMKEVGVVDAATGKSKLVTQYFTDNHSLNVDNIKDLYMNVYKGMKNTNNQNYKFLKQNQNVLSDSLKHTPKELFGDIENYLKDTDNFRIELSIIPSEVKDVTDHSMKVTRPFGNNCVEFDVTKPYDPNI